MAQRRTRPTITAAHILHFCGTPVIHGMMSTIAKPRLPRLGIIKGDKNGTVVKAKSPTQLAPSGISHQDPRSAEGLGAAEIDGVGLDQIGVELMLPDQLAEAIANFGPAIIALISIRRLGRKLFRLARARNRFGKRANFFDRADADAIGLAQGTINCTSLGYPHLGSMDQRRNVRRIGVTVSDKAPARFRLKDCRPKYPTRLYWIAGSQNGARIDARTFALLRKPKQSRMSNVPATREILEIAVFNRDLVFFDQVLQRPQSRLWQVSVKGLCGSQFPCEIGFG
jgi:hypothetical protein